VSEPSSPEALTVLYRGLLSSCNYGCEYCPFAKHRETEAEHALDAAALGRFGDWCLRRAPAPLSVFFTPWGEALTHRRYHELITRLSQAPHVTRVAAQTNLSAELDWLEETERRKVALWATYHPAWTTLDRFVGQCERLLGWGIRFSVGVVGLPAHRANIEALRSALPGSVYVWINAMKALASRYSAEELAFFESVDPLFRLTRSPHPSRGRACRAGERVISVDGEGIVRRCHFIPTPIGNIFDESFGSALEARACTNETCGCHIGYVHLEALGLERVYGEGLLERIPTDWSASRISHR
jgi:MoaA/NifB/PqqE/SkfB family radical SAM enzyme